MNAHKFVAEHGIEEANRVLSGAPKNSNWFQEKGKYSNDLFSCNHEIYGEVVMLSELKRVVESVEIVERSGGFDLVKAEIKNYRDSGDISTFSSLEKRLADYELVESYKGGKK